MDIMSHYCSVLLIIGRCKIEWKKGKGQLALKFCILKYQFVFSTRFDSKNGQKEAEK
jgi:hypothetical protein